jgi:dephospho-CoA kinase
MGKSTVASMFERAGVPAFDADKVVHELQSPGGAVVGKIGELFPGCVRSGTLDRQCLAQIVLSDPAKLALLENIVHPAVQASRDAFAKQHKNSPALLFDIPLLFETRTEGEFDKVIVVSAPPEVQRDRAMRRPGMTAEKLAAILARQLPDEEKRRRADFVIDTSGDLSTTESQVREIIACLGLAPKE